MMELNELRRGFDLPEEDREHLDARGLPWETVSEKDNQWLLIHDFPIPEGYSHRSVTAAAFSNGLVTARQRTHGVQK